MKKKSLLVLVCLCVWSTAKASYASPSSVDCTDSADDGVSDKTDISAVMWNIKDDWSNFESDVEGSSGHKLGSAIKSDFKNGNVECQYSPTFFELCGLLGGSAQADVFGAYVCGDFIDGIHSEAQKDRRACYAAILTKTFALSNLRFKSTATDLGEAAFDYWSDRFGSTISYGDCGI